MRALGERIVRGSLYEGKPSSRSLLVAKYKVLAFGENDIKIELWSRRRSVAFYKGKSPPKRKDKGKSPPKRKDNIGACKMTSKLSFGHAGVE